MTLESQVAPLALAQRMKELGFPQETFFVWREIGDDGHGGRYAVAMAIAKTHAGDHHLCAAPTVAEMGEWLPCGASYVPYVIDCRPDSDKRLWTTDFREGEEIHVLTEAEARARLLIALAEAGALDPKTPQSEAAS